MYIGELTKQTGASAKAIRLYEAQGLLGSIPRQGSYRVYSEKNVQQVQLIRQAQAIGFRLVELAPVLKTHDGEPDWMQLHRQLVLKRTALRQELRRLKQLDMRLDHIEREIQTCLAGNPTPANGLCEPTAAYDHSLVLISA